MLYVALRRALPDDWRVWVWTIVGATVGGSAILHADGVDFNLLEPTWLAVAMFVAIPAGGAALMARWVERWDAWWFTDRRRTIVAVLPTLILVPADPSAPRCGGGGRRRVRRRRRAPMFVRAVRVVGPPIGRAALAIVAALSSWALFNDVTEIL